MPSTFQQHRLPNGLTLIAETDPDAHTAAVGFFVKTGARDEATTLMGVSHFLEHMVFKGTARRTGEQINREFDQIGANYNAFTSHEATVYFAQVLPEYLPHAVDLLGDMLRPALRDDDFNMEKNVILEEIAMYDDRPQWRLQDHLLETFFAGHPLSHRVLGTAASINALTAEQMKSYFDSRYNAGNITVAAAGTIDFPKLLADVGKIAGDWKTTPADRKYDAPKFAHTQQTLSDPKVTRHYIMAVCPGPSAQHPLRYAAKIYADILGDSEGSRLYWNLVDPGLADSASFGFEPQDQIGCFIASASCDPDRARQVEQILIQTIDSCAKNINPDEIERAKNKLATAFTLHGERPMGRMHNLGGVWTYLAQYLPLEQELEKIMAVTANDIHALLRQIPHTPRTIVRLGPPAPNS